MFETQNNASWKSLSILILASVASLLLTSTLVSLVQSAPGDEVPLSGSGNLAANPRADMSDDGTYLAAVWVEDSDDNGEYRGDIMLKRATWDAGQSRYIWDADPVTIFDATGEGYLYADIDIQGNIAHIAAAYQNGNFVRIAYNQCDLTNPTPPSFGADGQTVIKVIDNKNTYVLSRIQVVASDNPAKPYITYGRNDGKIYYVRWDTSRGDDDPIDSPNTVSEFKAYKPQIAYTSGTDDNYVHFLWEVQLESAGTGYPIYRRCSENTGSCTDPVKLAHEDNIGTFPSPFLAAQGERLVAGWQTCTQGGGSVSNCTKFNMLYALSDDIGQSFVDLGGDEYPAAYIGEPAGYVGTDNPNKIYRARLQPAMTLDHTGLPCVAWQISKDAENYRHIITTTLAISETATGFEWDQIPDMEIGSPSYDRVKPFILVPHADRVPHSSHLRGLHLFYMRGNTRADPSYGVYYTYLQKTDPNAIPTDDATGEPTGEPTDEPMDNEIFLPLVMQGGT